MKEGVSIDESVLIAAIIYLALVTGALLKFINYGIRDSNLLWVPILPAAFLIALPVAFLFSVATTDEPAKVKFVSIFVVPVIAVKYFPVMVGVAADGIANCQASCRSNVIEITWPSYRQYCFESAGAFGHKFTVS